MQRPDIDAVLKPLKPFQRRTVAHGFHRLFQASDSTNRFLIADEVGLGKTLVARGIIGLAIDHLWERTDRIDIIYVCSNGSIARANLPKLLVSAEGDPGEVHATRLTMLATTLAGRNGRQGIADSKLNFISFTPGTSFKLGNSGGQARERKVLFHLLESLVKQTTPLMDFLQGGKSNTEQWRTALTRDREPIDPTIRTQFEREFRRSEIAAELDQALDSGVCWQPEYLPREERRRRNRLIGELRLLLARVCVKALKPELVILDEFQRFKSLLGRGDEKPNSAEALARDLFQAQTAEGRPARILLLSATPYKLYTTDAEIAYEDHYGDFLETTRFLMAEDDNRVQTLKAQLQTFGHALKQAASGQSDGVGQAKVAVENTLRAVMARTERVAVSEERDAMVEESRPPVPITTADVRQYLAADDLFKAVGDRDPMTFWKSAPYLAHFMRGYKFNERLKAAVEETPGKVVKVLKEHASAFLKEERVMNWSPIDPANGKLRELVTDLIDGGLWKLLWIPPTVPYWPLEGHFRGQEGRTKTLLFSAWNVVPDVVSAVLSYEAERRMVGGRLRSYQDPARQRTPRLRLNHSENGSRTRHRLFLLILPCLTLADQAHPLAAPPGVDRRQWVREQVERLLADPRLPDPTDGAVDERWAWAAPLVLDPGLNDFLRVWRTDKRLPHPGSSDHPTDNQPEQGTTGLFVEYVDDLLALDLRTLGRRPANLVELLTEVALGSPAIVAARTAATRSSSEARSISDATRRKVAVVPAMAFWNLFNRPAVIALLDPLDRGKTRAARDGVPYWRLVLRYCRDGNLQAVLDETWHLMREQRGWAEPDAVDRIAEDCAAELAGLVNPTASRVHAHFLARKNRNRIETPKIRLRTVFALRFGDIRNEDGDGKVSQDTVRAMFNSPFRPFVLTSTSVGQEGLDFHPWCHRLVHWDLPGNPVDLEQREGRVHRYKGHAVRRNVAAGWEAEGLARCGPGDDLWEILFGFANRSARAAGDSDLVPLWMAHGPHRVQRHVPLLPYSREVEAFARLKRQLATYRVVFGQPRQEEMMAYLNQSAIDVKQLQEWAIDLAPPALRPSGTGEENPAEGTRGLAQKPGQR